MPHLLNSFETCLHQFDIAKLDGLDNVVYGVDAKWPLAYRNPVWKRFARDNGGEPGITQDWGLERNLPEAIPGSLADGTMSRLWRRYLPSRTHHTLCAACLNFCYPDDKPEHTHASPGEKL